jgi:hypothetical protein
LGGGVKILKFFDVDPGSGMEKIRIRGGKNSDPGWKKLGSGIRDGKNSDPGSGMEKIRSRDGKNPDPGSEINIQDPQHWDSDAIQLTKKNFF